MVFEFSILAGHHCAIRGTPTRAIACFQKPGFFKKPGFLTWHSDTRDRQLWL
ncbi:MAG: hypothetical protein P5694_24735 [Limnospira sp. PMC 1286.21]|uniref:hypothetical protein n=1 Tax=unclassified Limnospira TaxID=2642885 RepID=UPI0028E135AA|nr:MULTISPECIES: hypothetical protein [unclassified Limnospira]MDT9328872.1 hypothetical protein [Limnospira sp. PMC 1286.21]MDT9211508.1 hypothetical protein [Limnospira sp. PMC 1252.20]MDT9221635.1 hypothetical protein [Limnospira sp. PMC 1240.20]MDT9262388.1 hypothetical protein [Limnospira sp. PMC 1236.20]MDT9303251.1 hypothetical protein [Limnospira sp. PMC 1281.21]